METVYQIPTHLPSEIFRAYDIRGEVGEDSLNEHLAYAIGRAIASQAQQLGRQSIIVGRDGRLSGPVLHRALLSGIVDSGCVVIDIGLVPTPLVYFATHILSTDCGVMVTASHNPKHHNGFKIVLAGQTLSNDDIQIIFQRIAEKNFVEGKGHVTHQDIIPAYIKLVSDRIQLKRPLKVVIDCGNGVASVVAPQVYRALGCELVELFCEIDGNFPNHHPDPTVPENLRALVDAVIATKADVGLAFDGDADRLGIVTDRGEVVWPDRQMMLYAKDVLDRVPGSPIVFDVKCSSSLGKIIESHGGRPIMFKTGHSLLKKQMILENAALAGEMSGHIFFKEGWFGFDDGIYVGARLLRILSNQLQTCSELFATLPNSFNTPEIKLPMAENKKSKFMQHLVQQGEFPAGERITIDGLRVEFDHGWGLVRSSNTSPNLILRFEADSPEHLEAIKAIFRRALLQIDGELNLPF